MKKHSLSVSVLLTVIFCVNFSDPHTLSSTRVPYSDLTNPVYVSTNQISVESVEAMSCVGVKVWLCLLVSDIVHDLVFPFPRYIVT